MSFEEGIIGIGLVVRNHALCVTYVPDAIKCRGISVGTIITHINKVDIRFRRAADILQMCRSTRHLKRTFRYLQV